MARVRAICKNFLAAPLCPRPPWLAARRDLTTPRRLRACGFEQYDYMGHFPLHPQDGYLPADGKDLAEYCDPRGVYPYASGGCGYWTSKRAMEAIVAAPLDWKRLDNKGNPAEDLWIPNILFPLGMRGYHDSRFLFKGDSLSSYGAQRGITVHLSTGTGAYSPNRMLRAYSLFDPRSMGDL